MKDMVEEGVVPKRIDQSKFKLSPGCAVEPIELGIEFQNGDSNFYYTISVENNQVIYESLLESKMETDELIFERKLNGSDTQIKLFENFYDFDPKNKFFVSVLEEKILKKNQLLFSFLGKEYEAEFPVVKKAFDWFGDVLTIITPDRSIQALAHILDTKDTVNKLANDLICSYKTGISKLVVDKRTAEEYFDGGGSKGLEKFILELKDRPNNAASIRDRTTGEEIVFINDGSNIVTKTLYTEHAGENDVPIKFSLQEESDGTRRLLDFIPAVESLVNRSKVFLIDEIERSIHPLTIKEIISKFSLDEKALGQLIFTTHESSLLDQEILRPDEIWFCQKDVNGVTKLYSLNDYKVHNTINVEQNYLNGRYGGIPFLSNLHDLNWHNYSDVK